MYQKKKKYNLKLIFQKIYLKDRRTIETNHFSMNPKLNGIENENSSQFRNLIKEKKKTKKIVKIRVFEF